MTVIDTIFVLSTPPGRSGVAVVRVSGPAAWDSLERLSGVPKKLIQPRVAHLKRLIGDVSRETIDEALVLPFKGPESFTGEDIAEYHVHGSQAVIKALMDELAAHDGHRLAEPGEFTRRAFENGKMDLTKAEAIADLIDAQTEAQKAQALAQMGGALSRLYNSWAETLKTLLAHVEADLEFPDEDLPEGILPEILPKVEKLAGEISEHLNDNRRGERLRDGVQVAVIGSPNVGKSSLVNALAQRDVAIVSDLAGTTRDVIEVHLDVDGYPVILADTAGLRPDQISNEGQDAIEQEGIRRALERARQADIRVLVLDGSEEAVDQDTMDLRDDSSIVVVNKADQSRVLPMIEGAVSLSAETGDGLIDLIDALSEKIKALVGLQETPSLTRERHRVALLSCQEALGRALKAQLPELAAEDLRLAIRSLGRITGKVDVEDLLDVVFRDFCIGK